MKNAFILSLVYIFSIAGFAIADDIVGFWKTVDEKTGKPQSVIALYEYQGKYYGRIIETFDEEGQIQETLETPQGRAPGVKGNPYYVGLDIVWDLQKQGEKYINGHILDPEKGNVYNSEAWLDGDGNLIVRGELLIFGRNQTWPPAIQTDFPKDFKKPDLTTMVPKIPQVK